MNFRLSDAITVYGARVIAQGLSVFFFFFLSGHQPEALRKREREREWCVVKNDPTTRHGIPLHNSRFN